MPELPEVETVRSIVGPQVAGKTIDGVLISNSQVIAYPSAETFRERMVGQKVSSMGRRGKFMTVFMESGDRLVIHLRMTGQLIVTPPVFPEEKQTHLTFRLSDGNQLRYIDTRRFGRFLLFEDGEEDSSRQEDLGPEPDDITPEYILTALGGRRRTVKECLLDQSVIAGIGKYLFRRNPVRITHISYGVCITKNDVIEAGKAMGAIRAGHRTLMYEVGLSDSDVKTMYMAGASGTYVDPIKAQYRGMIPVF